MGIEKWADFLRQGLGIERKSSTLALSEQICKTDVNFKLIAVIEQIQNSAGCRIFGLLKFCLD